MKQRNSFLTINDLLHAVVVFGVCAVSAYGFSDELFDFGDLHLIAVVAYALAVAVVTCGVLLAQPSLAAIRGALVRRRLQHRTTSL
jgi:hypothetical protein